MKLNSYTPAPVTPGPGGLGTHGTNGGSICGTPGQRHRHKPHCDKGPVHTPPTSKVGNGRNEVRNFLNSDI